MRGGNIIFWKNESALFSADRLDRGDGVDRTSQFTVWRG
jgi:hypothetical protein